MAALTLSFEPTALSPLGSAVPSFAVVTTTTLIQTVANFDDTIQEYLSGKFTVPADIGSGNVTFRANGFSGTAAAANVAFDFDHASVAADEDLDSASYTVEASGDSATINNQNDLEQHEWTETVANLGWVAGDVVFFRVSREAASASNLSGDWRMSLFDIEIPLA